MKMVIGGAYQGKTDYAKQVYPNLVWSDGASCDLKDIFSCSGIVHFEEFVRRWIRENKAEHATDLAEQILQENPDLIVVTVEVGYGLVPVDAFERQYREAVGRICTNLAACADRWIGYSAGSGSGSSEKENRKMKIELENVLPQEIEKRSFEIITEELGEVSLIPGTEPIVKRCIHTSADFEYAKSLKFSEDAVQRAMDAIRDGAWIVTDTQMGKSGINKKKLAQYGGEVCCFMSDEETANMAKEQGTTRAVAAWSVRPSWIKN